MCKYLFESLRYNRCLIKLDKVEKKFLYESLIKYIKDKDINIEIIKKTISRLSERTDIRYFSDKHIDSISIDLLDRINNFIEESVARDWQTVSYSSKPELLKRSVGICTQTGKYIVFCGNKEVYFNDKDSAIIYARNNNCY